MMEDIVRPAEWRDAEAIARVYNQGIEDRTATFETEPCTEAEIRVRLEEAGERYPMVVVERDGHVIAWAGTSPYRPRACYAGIAEFSVYTDRGARGTGAGRLALEGLIRAADARGYWKLVSRIFPDNSASLSLCRSLGFREVGIYRQHGRLDGVWRDVVIVEKLLSAATVDDSHPNVPTGP